MMSLLLQFTQSQSWNQTTFNADVMPEILISNHKTMIISEVLNDRNRIDQHTRDIYDELSNRIIEIDGLSLVDREKTKSLLKEFQFQQSSGLVSDDEIRKLGDFYGSGLIAFIRIQRDEFEDEIISSTSMIRVNGCNTTKYRKATYVLDVNVKFIDLQTAKVIYSKNLTSSFYKKSKGYDCKTPPKYDKNELYPDCVADIGQKFKKIFIKHQVGYKAIFQRHNKINDQLKNAITYFNINEFEKGYKIICAIPNATVNRKAKSSALYNLALVQFYSGHYNESLANAKEAYVLNPKNDECLTIVNTIQ